MGGSSGRGSGTLGDTKALEQRAKEILTQTEGRKNVFISFAYEDVDEVNLLRAQAKNEKNDLEFNDWSVKVPYESERAEYIRQKLRERIEQSSVTVVYVSKHTASSEWVKWEVEKSLELGKRVVAVYAGADSPTLPGYLKSESIDLVPWADLAAALGS